MRNKIKYILTALIVCSLFSTVISNSLAFDGSAYVTDSQNTIRKYKIETLEDEEISSWLIEDGIEEFLDQTEEAEVEYIEVSSEEEAKEVPNIDILKFSIEADMDKEELTFEFHILFDIEEGDWNPVLVFVSNQTDDEGAKFKINYNVKMDVLRISYGSKYVDGEVKIDYDEDTKTTLITIDKIEYDMLTEDYDIKKDTYVGIYATDEDYKYLYLEVIQPNNTNWTMWLIIIGIVVIIIALSVVYTLMRKRKQIIPVSDVIGR